MTDYSITSPTALSMTLGSNDNGLVAPSGVVSTSGRSAVRMEGNASGMPSLTVLGTVWAGGTYAGVDASDPGSITVGAAGSILSARGDGIAVLGPASDALPEFRVANDGFVQGRGAGLDTSLVNLRVTNGGTIRGVSEEGIDARGAFHTIRNAGTVEGSAGIRLEATLTTRIVNDGVIAGNSTAIHVSGADATILNRGTLSGIVYMETASGSFDGRGGGAATVIGSEGMYTIRGGAGDDVFHGGTGVDALYGGAGDDVLGGGDGADLLVGGEGDDTLWGDDGEDVLIGGNADDLLWGDGGNDVLDGGAGEDVLHGLLGDDTLTGGVGDDTLGGGAGSDTARFRGAGAITVDLNLTEEQDTRQGHDLLLGIENVATGGGDDVLVGNAAPNRLISGGGSDRIFGNGAHDVLEAGAGNDTLSGGDGKDRLAGGTGNDRLNGGAGKDIFDFRAGDGRDIVQDFQNGIDRLDLRGLASGVDDITVAQSGANAVLRTGDVQITLLGVTGTLIDASDFIF